METKRTHSRDDLAGGMPINPLSSSQNRGQSPGLSRREAEAAAREERIATVVSDAMDAAQRGDVLDIDAIYRDHPDLAADLRELLPTVLVVDAMAGSSDSLNRSRIDSSGRLSPLERAVTTGEPLEIFPRPMGDYILLAELGRGGMGVVYEARQVSLDRFVAVKMIRETRRMSAEEVVRFEQEARAAAKLDHPHIVPIYDIGVSDGHPYFSMRLIEGGTLADRLRQGPLTPREAAAILAKVARAIDVAHQSGVLHRDLKPSNILLDTEGEPWVTDFGLAKQLEADGTLTQTGAILGTPAYIPPEQAAGNRGVVGPASDVWSLGVILYQMITGHPPFQSATAVDTLLLVLEQDPPAPTTLNPRADRDLSLIAMRCLQKPVDLRYRSAGALADDLERYLADEPISARSARLTQVVTRMLRATHHAPLLENWGLIWMWHSLAVLVVFVLTNALHAFGVFDRIWYAVIWGVGGAIWAAVVWWLRQRLGPVSFVERQIVHVWAGCQAASLALSPLEYALHLNVLTLSPVLAILGSMAFFIKAGILSGEFYVCAAALALTAITMTAYPDTAQAQMGIVSAACFFFPGLKYYRQRLRTVASQIPAPPTIGPADASTQLTS